MASTTYVPETVFDRLPGVRAEVAPSQSRILQRWQRILLAGVVVLTPLMLYVCFTASIGDPAADHRLAPTFAIVHGYQLYYPADHGPVLSTIYGPVTALVYLPATMAATPGRAIFLAAFITMVLFYGGSWFALQHAAETPKLKWWQMLAVLVAVTWAIPPLQRAASFIHADAPALAFAGIATAFAIRSNWRISRWENEFLAGAFAVASMLAKQNMAPLLAGLTVWIFLRSRWKGLGIFGGSVGVASAATLALIEVRLGGVKAFLFNCYYLPRHQPYVKALAIPAWSQLVIASFALLAIPIFLVIRDWSQADVRFRCFSQERKTLLLLLLGLALVPTSIAGRMKYGATESALCPTLFFFALFLVAELAGTRSETDRRAGGEAGFAMFPVLLFCLIAGLPAAYLALRARPSSPVQQVFSYCQNNPERVYFPQFPLAQLMAEGKLYHFSWGLSDRRAAGVPVTDAHFAANIPDATVMAILPWVPEWDSEVAKHHAGRIASPDAPRVEGFEFFAIRPR